MLYTSGNFNSALQRCKTRNKKRGYGASIVTPYETEQKTVAGKWFVTCKKKSHLMNK